MGGIRLLLVRHGESVDNVASLYPSRVNAGNISGSRDAALTAHGALQAKHLASHLVERGQPLVAPSHFFASDLQRAWRTAEAIREGYVAAGKAVPEVQRLPELREKDFGSLEGLYWAKPAPPITEGWVEPETPEAIVRRVTQFFAVHLFPALEELLDGSGGEDRAVVVVAHGITLGHLVNALVTRLRSAKCPVYGLPDGGAMSWRNTGYFECLIEPLTPGSFDPSHPQSSPVESRVAVFPSGIKATVERVNCVDHLAGLTRTRGGIGSARFDASQRTLDGFFTKKPN